MKYSVTSEIDLEKISFTAVGVTARDLKIEMFSVFHCITPVENVNYINPAINLAMFELNDLCNYYF